MLEGLAAWVLNTYIGEYLENLNTDQLSIGLLQGYAELENVPLKRTALRKFDVPLCVRAGVIGKLTLSVPLTHLKSEPWVVTVNDLYVVLEPSHYHYDMEFEAQYIQEKKKLQLDALEISHKRRLADGAYYVPNADSTIAGEQSPSGSGWWAYGASVVSTIVENIQLIATNVHIRYEDDVTIPGCSFACGLKIGRFSVQTADSAWTPGFVLRRDGDNIRKLVELKEFSVYWDTGGDHGFKLMAPESYKDLLQKMKEPDKDDFHRYLLSPLGLRVKMEKNTSKIPLKTSPPSPRFKFDLEPDRVNLQGGRRQFTELRWVIDEWQRYRRGKPYRKWRPKAVLSRETAKQWWKFAIICHLESIRQRNERHTWKYLCTRARQVNAYCKAYIRLLSGRPKEFTKGDEILMRQIEREYGFDELQLLREGAMRYGLRNGLLGASQNYLSISASPEPNSTSANEVGKSPSSSSLSTPVHTPRGDDIQSPAASGSSVGILGGWLGYLWSGSGSNQQATRQQPPQQLLYPPPKIMEPLKDDPALHDEIQKVEQVLEEELWDMYNETMDESAVMGRDLLFAAVNLSMKSFSIAFAGGYNEGLSSNEASGPDTNEIHQCLADASLDFALRMKYLTDPDNRNIVTPSFELSAKFGSGLNLCFNNKQYESVLQTLAGWTGKMETEQDFDDRETRSRKTSFATGTSRRSSSAILLNKYAMKKIAGRKDRVDFQLVADVEVPKLSIELRSDFNADAVTMAAGGQPLVSILCENMSVVYRKTKPHICVVETSMASFNVIDLLEGSKTPNLPYLMKASGGIKDVSADRLAHSFLSTSCPDITNDNALDDSALILSTSLPSSAVSPPSMLIHAIKQFLPATPPSTPTCRREARRKSDEAGEKEKLRWTSTSSARRSSHSRSRSEAAKIEQCSEWHPGDKTHHGVVHAIVTLVDSVHEDFYGSYKQVGTLVSIEAGDFDVVINEQTFIILLDFLGFLTPPPSENAIGGSNANGDSFGIQTSGGKKLQVDTAVRSLKIVMNKPTDGCQLARMLLDDLQACLVADEIGFSLNGQSSSFRLFDETPVYSRLYPERLNFVADGDKNLQFLFYKYKKADMELKREFDACLALYTEDIVHYVHTQRLLSDIIQFWNHFAQVYDLYGNAKAASLGIPKPEGICHGFRLKLRVDMRGAKLYLPISALDSLMIVAEMNRLVADNDFLFSSVLEEGRQSTSQDDFDCLVDVLQLHLEDVQLFEAMRVPDDGSYSIADTPMRNIFAKERRQLMDFKGFSIIMDSDNLLDRAISMDISVARNLDTGVARTIPDMAIHTSVNSVKMRLHVDTYATIRAVLDHNLGEEVPPQASSTSIAQITTACATSGPWTTLEITCDLNDVFVDCFTPTSGPDSAPALNQLARMDLERVKFSFESFSDGVHHIDLICNDARLVDTRFDGEAANKRENVFSTVWSSNDRNENNETARIPKGDKLLGEIHYATERHCSTLTLVFSRARLLFISDWLLLAREFLMAQAPIHRVSKENLKTRPPGPDAPQDVWKLEKWKSHRSNMLSKTRVLTRAEFEDMKKEDFKLKATLLDTEIVVLEKPSSRNSLALVLKATASLYFENVDDRIRFECRDSNLQLFDCVYGNREETTTALTNLFSFTAELAAVPKVSRTAKYVNLGLLDTVPQMHEYRMKMSLGNLMARLSYRDYLVLRAICDAHKILWDRPESMASQSFKQHAENAMIVEKIELKLESVNVCFLDDYQDTRFPLFKLSVKDGVIEHKPGKSPRDLHEGCGALVIEISYFNQKVYGWEPLLEAWRVDNLTWAYNSVMHALNLEVLGDKLLDLTLTKTFMQQTRHFWNYWPTLSEALSKDFRSGFTKRLDILPYLLVNHTGSLLSFATCLSGQRRDNNGRKTSSNKWITVNDGETRQFSFESDPWQSVEAENPDPFLTHHVTIQVDGWHEINPIPVDAVGTFFRLARLDNAKKSSLSNAVSYTRLVAAVNIDQDGRKVVTIRSALMLVNGLTDPLTVRLEGTSFVGEHTEFVLSPGAVKSAPLAFANSKVLVKPGASWSYCKPVNWGHISQREQVANYVRTCSMEGQRYRICVSVKAESYPEIYVDGGVIPGHTLSFVPPLIVYNLLPGDLHVSVINPAIKTTVPSGQWSPFVELDPVEAIELKFETEYFHSRQSLFIHPTAFQEQRLELEMIDQLRRPLILNARLTPIKGGAVKVTISAPFWFVNKSGLPFVIKQEACEEAAGQFDEHEHARSMTPVLFSFAESGAPLKCCLRLGKLVHPDCVSDWCRSFVLEPGITFKELRSIPVSDRRPARVYNIGVEVRPGQGLYKDTHVVLLTARYLIDNRTRYKLHISQLYDTERQSNGQYTVAPNCSLAWHWPRQDLDLLLCVRRDDLPYWSSPFRIDQLKSFHLTLRDSQFTPQFLRLEIILRGAVYYVTFSSAENIPPPIRIENMTDAPILYNQKSCDANHLRAILRPHTQVNYSFDDTQFKPPIILLTAQNGKTVEYDLTILGQGEPLLYENFIYIIFAKTVDESIKQSSDDADLVLEALSQGKIVLGRKDPQKPQQLWRMRSDGHLVNAADWSHLTKHGSDAGIQFVLDILPVHCDGSGPVPLMLKRADPNRRTTQRWRFTEDGRLVCGLNDMYVQAERTPMKAGMAAILGLTPNIAKSSGGVPAEQLITRQRQRPGSGRLAVTILLDGPTRVLRITDMADHQIRRAYPIQASKCKMSFDQSSEESQSSQSSSTTVVNNAPIELACSCTLNSGVGLSVVNNDLEELIYCRLTGLILNARRERGKYTLGVKVLEIQADNQLWNAERWTLLYMRSKFDEKQDPTFLALDLLVQWTPLPAYDSFDTFIVSINKVALYIDEVLLWKLLLFFANDASIAGGIEAGVFANAITNQDQNQRPVPSKLYQHSPQPNMELDRPDPKQARRCYFGILNLTCRRMYLSVVTASVLPPQLRHVKQMYNMPLIRFENASVEITPFQQSYYFETMNFLMEALHKHFTQELRSQAMKILGSVDFLGNPVGLFRDVSDSLQELIISGNVSGFVTGVMHGFSNSAAKITSSLSDQVGKIMDDGHRQLRESVRQSQSQDAMGHLLTGVKGLGIGVVGGVTSVFTQPVDGMKKDGFEGLFTGVVKGVVGMVAKPVQGVLDLATGVSNATREAVSGSDGPLKSRFRQTRLRFPRVTRNLQGTLPPYSEQLAAAQKTLLSINDGTLRELCLSMDHCCSLQQQAPILVIISTTNVYFVRRRRPDDVRVLLNIAYNLLQGCTCVVENTANEHSQTHGILNWHQPYLEFTLKTVDPQSSKRRIKCDTMEKATDLCQKILYAKQQYEEQERSLAIPEFYGIDQI